MDDKLKREIDLKILPKIEEQLSPEFIRELPSSLSELVKYAKRRTDPVISENIPYPLGQKMLNSRMSDEEFFIAFLQALHATFYEKELSSSPTAYILVAQTGAGKTNLSKLIFRTNQSNTVLINPDNCKKYNPNYRRFSIEDPTHVGALTGIDSYDHANDMTEYAMDKGYNILFECAPSERQGLLGINLDELYARQYDARFKMLAVGDLTSLIAIHNRYEQDLKTGINTAPKLTDIRRHDDSYRGVVNAVKDHSNIGNTQIYRRGTETEGFVPQVITDDSNTPDEIYSILTGERYNSNHAFAFGKVSPSFLEMHSKILYDMMDRNAPREQVEQLMEIYNRYIKFKAENDSRII